MANGLTFEILNIIFCEIFTPVRILIENDKEIKENTWFSIRFFFRRPI